MPFEIFDRNAASGVFGLRNELLADVMVEISLETLLPSSWSGRSPDGKAFACSEWLPW